jgi:Protein kinase domain
MNKSIKTSDSITDGIETLAKCRRCGAMTQLDHGTCINCFLREGLETKGEGSREAFESVLVEDDVTDTEWRLGHYEILEEIGRGGMGVIYRARQQHSRRIVAVKRILAHQVNSHETLVRFRREAEAVASLDHPNILPIYEVSESEEALPFFSMKYATGGSLRMAAPSLRAKPRECVRLMAKIARAIAFAHRKGILHRDLIRLLRLRRRDCVRSRHRSIATWRQSLLAVWRAILPPATNPPERWPRILSIGCGTNRFRRDALEFSLVEENGFDAIQRPQC